MSNSYILPLKLHQLKKFSTCAIGSESSIDYCMQTAVNYTLQLFYLVSFARTSKSVNNMEFRFALLSMFQFARKMEQAQTLFSNVSLAHDVETARQLLQQHQDLKKSRPT